MLILALDTTTRAGSAAVARDDDVLGVRAGNPERTHGERLPGEIARVLADAGVEAAALDLLVVASGPGAFTGLRIGLAAMQGLALTLGRPIVGVSALDALVWTHAQHAGSAGPVAAWMDAQRGEVFAALYQPDPAADPPWRLERAPAADTPAATLAALDPAMAITFVGDGARRYGAAIAAASPAWRLAADERPLAPALAWLGRRLAARGLAGPPHALQPLYVRRPDAEIERERRQAP